MVLDLVTISCMALYLTAYPDHNPPYSFQLWIVLYQMLKHVLQSSALTWCFIAWGKPRLTQETNHSSFHFRLGDLCVFVTLFLQLPTYEEPGSNSRGKTSRQNCQFLLLEFPWGKIHYPSSQHCLRVVALVRTSPDNAIELLVLRYLGLQFRISLVSFHNWEIQCLKVVFELSFLDIGISL